MANVDITIRTIDKSSPANKKVVGSFTELNSAISLIQTGMRVANQIYDQTIGKTLEYANSVRSLAAISGESAEDTSRFIQVLDDFKLGIDDVNAATRALTKEGLAPTIETLAMLSDRYLALNSVEEKNKLIIDNLGRGGLKWVEVLEKGSDALLKMGDSVNENLILNQKMLDDARKQEIAVDNLTDAWMGYVTQLSTNYLPVITKVMNDEVDLMRAREMAKEDGLNIWLTTEKQAESYIALAKAEREATEELMLQSRATEEAAAITEAYNKDLTEINQTRIGMTKSMQSVEESYQETAKQLAEERAQIAADDLEALAENDAAVLANKENYIQANREIMLGYLERKLMADGILTDNELNWLLEKGVAWGVYSQTVVDQTKTAIEEANKLINSIPDVTNKYINIVTIGDRSGVFEQTQGEKDYIPTAHAAGGNFMIPMSYGNEGFRMGNGDTASGGEMVSITPKGQGGNGDLIAAIQANKMDENKLARSIVKAMAMMGG